MLFRFNCVCSWETDQPLHPSTVGAGNRWSAHPSAGTRCAGAQGSAAGAPVKPPCAGRGRGQLFPLTRLKPRPPGWRHCHSTGESDSFKPSIFAFGLSLPQRALWAAGTETWGKWGWDARAGRQDRAVPASTSSVSHGVFSVLALQYLPKNHGKNFS